jgi:8-oxo-dGTP diphosphatase
MASNPQVILKDRYQVVPRSIIFLIQKGKVLLQKGRADKKIYPGYLNGIGGHIERGEDILSGARRELTEESGLSCPDLKLAGTVVIDVNEKEGILLFVLTGSHITGELRDSNEGSLEWVDISDLDKLLVVEDVPELVANSLASLEDVRLFFGKYEYNDLGQRITTWQWG